MSMIFLYKLCRTEQCDDGNLLDGDGCSKTCLKETGFNCQGEPSLCYVFEADGICEDFEKRSGMYELSCQQNPLVVNVTHDLSRPFFLTSSVLLLFSSRGMAVGGVALRTSCHFNAFAQTGYPQVPKHDRLWVPTNVCGGHVGAELRCVQGSWDRLVGCSQVDCGVPDPSYIPHAVFTCPQGTVFRQQCTFNCSPPATLQGHSERVECLADGLWSLPEAFCRVECPSAPLPPNTTLLTAGCRAPRHQVGVLCRYRCHPGYHVTGSHRSGVMTVITDHVFVSRTYLELECLEGGQWEESGCDPVTCPPLPEVFQGMYTCTTGLRYDSLCTLWCPHDTLTIRCTEEASWSQDLIMCAGVKGSCQPPANFSSLEYGCDQGSHVGAVCYPACIMAPDMQLHDPVVLPNATTASTLQHWMRPTRVQRK
ncbi:hypothetical protein CRUP_023799 [Coryphaenoides rupestris]|nr:hypothetical protein CRUP_023799 [Coryphaenoides rupestris]